MRLLLLNINYLRHYFFVKTIQKKIMDFEHPNSWGYILMVNKIMLITKNRNLNR